MNEKNIEKTPVGYRLDFKQGDPSYYGLESYEIAKSSGNDNADTWGLYPEPQLDCSQEVEVYHGWCWKQPKYVYNSSLEGLIPLYRGPAIRHRTMPEEVAFLFPSFIETKLKQEFPHLYPDGT